MPHDWIGKPKGYELNELELRLCLYVCCVRGSCSCLSVAQKISVSIVLDNEDNEAHDAKHIRDESNSTNRCPGRRTSFTATHRLTRNGITTWARQG
jgi:hypothetical protein